MSLDHFFISKNTGEEVAYFGHNHFVQNAFEHIVGKNYDADPFPVSKTELENAVKKFEDVLNAFDCKTHSGYCEVNGYTKTWIVRENHVIADLSGSVALYKVLQHFPTGFDEFMRREDGAIIFTIERIFGKISWAYEQLKRVLETFDFENDNLIIEQAG